MCTLMHKEQCNLHGGKKCIHKLGLSRGKRVRTITECGWDNNIKVDLTQ
jgi:hypothetical protein